MNIDALLQSHGADAPSGPDVEYDDDFMELEIAARPTETRQVGDTTVEGEEPDFRDVYDKASAILVRTHDLRAAVYATGAGVRVHGLQAMADGTSLIRGVLEQYWDSCHPLLDEDDDDDPTARVNALRNLADNDTVIRALRLAPLSESRSFGRITMRDILVSEGEMAKPADMDAAPDGGAISAAFQDTEPEALADLYAASVTSQENVNAIDAIFDEKTPGLGPDLEPLKKLMYQIVTRLAAVSGAESAAEMVSGEEDAMAPGSDAPARTAAPSAPGTITSRADVTNAIERIIGYYESYEPSSPLPLLLNRAKRLVNADFMTIMRDMAPAGVENVSVISGDDE